MSAIICLQIPNKNIQADRTKDDKTRQDTTRQNMTIQNQTKQNNTKQNIPKQTHIQNTTKTILCSNHQSTLNFEQCFFMNERLYLRE